jgi:hypothetical protein
MTLILEAGTGTALADALKDHIDTGTAPELVFETVGDVAVADIILNATQAFDNAIANVITMADQPLSDTNAVGGLVAQFSIYINAAQTGKVLEGDVQVAGGDINLSSLTVGATDTVELTTFTLTVPLS